MPNDRAQRERGSARLFHGAVGETGAMIECCDRVTAGPSEVEVLVFHLSEVDVFRVVFVEHLVRVLRCQLDSRAV